MILSLPLIKFHTEFVTPAENFQHEQDQINDENEDDFAEDDNPLDDLRVGSTETMLISTIPYSVEEENVIIAPGENKKPISLLLGQYCEEFAFPYLLPKGRFGYNVERSTQLSASKYFNQRLLNYTQRLHLHLIIYFLRILFCNKNS